MRFLIRGVKREMTVELWEKVFGYIQTNLPKLYDTLSKAVFIEAVGRDKVVDVLIGFETGDDKLAFKMFADKKRLQAVLQQAFQMYPMEIYIGCGDDTEIYRSNLLHPLMQKCSGKVFDLELKEEEQDG